MGQMTPGQARVIDPVLTNVARGYKNSEFIGMKLFPYVPVLQRGGKIIQFNKESFRLYSTVRAPGASTKRVQFGYAGMPYALEQHALEGLVPFENMEEANAVPGIDLASGAVNQTQDIIALALEYNQAKIATDPANYNFSNKVALSGASQWSDYAGSDPLVDVEAAKETIRKQTGKRPNLMVIGAAVMEKLKYHPKLLDAALLSSAISSSSLRIALDAAQIAGILGLDEIVVGDAIYLDASDNAQDVWGKHAILAFTGTASLASMGAPSYGYTYRLQNYPVVESPYQERNEKSWIYPVTDEVSPVIAGADAGYLIENAVA